MLVTHILQQERQERREKERCGWFPRTNGKALLYILPKLSNGKGFTKKEQNQKI